MRSFRRRILRMQGLRLQVRFPYWCLPVLMLLISLVVVEHNVTPVLRVAAEQKARMMALDAINRAVMQRTATSLAQKELVHYQYDHDGRVSLLSVDTPLINQVAADSALAAQSAMDTMARSRVDIPLGQAMGSVLLANVGPNLPVHFSPLGTVQVTVGQRFLAAGINQTRHVVYLQATARLQVFVPLVTSEVTVTTELPLTENVIVGSVPQTYWQGGNGVITSVPAPGR